MEDPIMPRPRHRGCLQSCYRLDLNHLLRNGLKGGRSLIGFGGEQAVMGTLTAYFCETSSSWLHLQLPPDLDQTIGLVCSPRPFGGVQWYMRCPRSGHRASVLYRPRGAPLFASQKYWRRRYGYVSQFMTPTDRAHRNICSIEARLSPVNSEGEDDGCLYRARGMRQRTFERLWAELDRNEDVLNERLVRVAARLMRWAR
jgi:hypothetical protein